MMKKEWFPDTSGDCKSNGIWRRMFEDVVTFQPSYLDEDDSMEWDYAVCKYPFVPGFHVVELDDDGDTEYVLSSHKTLHEAMGVCKILLANGGARYV